MRGVLGFVPAFLLGQELYMGSEFMLLRFYKGYYPPLLATGVMGGGRWKLFSSGSAYKLTGWAEARVMYPVGASRSSFAPGATAGLAAQVEIPSRIRQYIQLSLGVDAYSLRFSDRGGSVLLDRQLRPIILGEIGSYAFADGIFLRYGFYPTPGTTGKYVFAIGSYIGD
ncbi:MAG: hypothetical protein N2253_08570 [Bacteroidia bacterium]|nr:hypothetical protein [Bacteroidia bacterium]